jgi:hypothetical protein
MTTIPLTLSNSSSPPFQTGVTLEGNQYTLSVVWNFSGQRWYFSLTDQYGNLTYMGALVGSPFGYDILLAPGLFQTNTLLYRSSTGNIEVGP